MKKKNKSDEEISAVREEAVYYQCRGNKEGIVRMISQKTLDEECMTLAESRELILKKVHNHFRNL